jgi:hypothetical protein
MQNATRSAQPTTARSTCPSARSRRDVARPATDKRPLRGRRVERARTHKCILSARHIVGPCRHGAAGATRLITPRGVADPRVGTCSWTILLVGSRRAGERLSDNRIDFFDAVGERRGEQPIRRKVPQCSAKRIDRDRVRFQRRAILIDHAGDELGSVRLDGTQSVAFNHCKGLRERVCDAQQSNEHQPKPDVSAFHDSPRFIRMRRRIRRRVRGDVKQTGLAVRLATGVEARTQKHQSAHPTREETTDRLLRVGSGARDHQCAIQTASRLRHIERDQPHRRSFNSKA